MGLSLSGPARQQRGPSHVLQYMESDDPGGAAALHWSSPDGGVLAVAYAQGSHSMGILHGTRYTPIPWSPHIATAAW